jgi:dephospho-CoA kinase
MEDAPMAVVGLTGGIASGKSTVARRMAERGVPVVDADLVAREVVEPGTPVLRRIAATFGDDVLLPDGRLDRKRLGARVFSDPEALRRLNALTHPAILSRVAERLRDLLREGHPWVVYEAALVLENGLAPGLSALVAVVSDPEDQVRRAVSRDGLPVEEARRRLAAQTDNRTRRERADLVIENAGTLDDLLRRTDEVVDLLSARFGAPKGSGPAGSSG